MSEASSDSEREVPVLDDVLEDVDAAQTDLSSNATTFPGKQPNLTSLIASKINELERDATRDEEEERDIAKAVKAEHRKLSSLVNETDTELGKVSLLQRKYSILFSDMQRLDREHVRQKARTEKFMKEMSTSKSELNKAVTMKHKLETLCRELQKENKRVKEESKKLAQSEQQRRIELNNKFESTIFEIKTKMDEDSGSAGKRRFEDNELKDKFRSFLEQYELREQHFMTTLRAMELDCQLHQAKADQSRKAAEGEALRATNLHIQVSTFSETEAELRNQLNIYVEKFKQVEDTLNNSNDLFLNFRKEMETMTRKTKKLEKENSLIRSKCDTANKNILEMAEERANFRKEIDSLRQKSLKLENLCRALQSERAKASANPSPTTTEPIVSHNKVPQKEQQLELRSGLSGHAESESEGSLHDEYSQTSFELDSNYVSHPPSEPPPSNPPPEILGFLKVSFQEECMIRENRREHGYDTHTKPDDKDQDGYLAVTGLEKELISCSRTMNTSDAASTAVDPVVSEAAQPPDRTLPSLTRDASDIAGKFSLFQKMFSSIPNLPSITHSNTTNLITLDNLTREERRLYEEACARLTSMSTKYASKPMTAEQVQHWENNLSKEGADLLFSATTESNMISDENHARQLEAFKKQIPAEKLREFSQQYETMMRACTSLVQSPETLDQTYEALMTSMAILLSEGDLASLQSKWDQSQKHRIERQDSKKR